MKKLLAIVAMIVSIPLLVFGVIFLIAAATNPSRLFVAAVLLLFGGALLLVGALTLRRLAEISPEALATGVIDLARRLGGEVTVAQVQAEFRIPSALALSTLEKLRGRGECQREQRTDHDVYVFKSVMPAKAIKRCPYCGSEFAVKSALRECPNCGAMLEIVKE
ncbi:MAG: hypothetical protein H5T68_04600 [Chloroflexi bacterium]|nr:hypothetical protein [Chloroflexota bacterium]